MRPVKVASEVWLEVVMRTELLSHLAKPRHLTTEEELGEIDQIAKHARDDKLCRVDVRDAWCSVVVCKIAPQAECLGVLDDEENKDEAVLYEGGLQIFLIIPQYF